MDVLTYKKLKAQLELKPRTRGFCTHCLQPQVHCYCHAIHRFDPKIKFVILIHPIEVKRRIATGRMSHLCLERSELITGHDYSNNLRVNEIIADPQNHAMVLYPGGSSINLTSLSKKERLDLLPDKKNLVVFVIDGTWHTARKMIRLSQNICDLPRICFTPSTESNFRVRKQPAKGCYSTIEAIHHTLELLETTDEHHKLIHAFNTMVENQLKFVKRAPRILDRLKFAPSEV